MKVLVKRVHTWGKKEKAENLWRCQEGYQEEEGGDRGPGDAAPEEDHYQAPMGHGILDSHVGEEVTTEGTVRGQAETESKELSKDYQAASDGQARERQ